MLPGGLAAAEGSLDGLLLLLKVTREPSVAAAATLLIRFGTLWLGVAVGLIGLTAATSRLTDKDLSVGVEVAECASTGTPDGNRAGREPDELSSVRGSR
jgi:hypothetical protein